ncbi:hypothetical protein O181_010655 [Austropuccinia psidii MF-1]|uniref:Uncharacterized protein n=1 Tax=Austropuccinia psidii MF-1 TaxID=1389203 RepID=A0A9Q3BUB2_9BASI|nr:hypothetical protein [Austropuccinia psidii MF-1]
MSLKIYDHRLKYVVLISNQHLSLFNQVIEMRRTRCLAIGIFKTQRGYLDESHSIRLDDHRIRAADIQRTMKPGLKGLRVFFSSLKGMSSCPERPHHPVELAAAVPSISTSMVRHIPTSTPRGWRRRSTAVGCLTIDVFFISLPKLMSHDRASGHSLLLAEVAGSSSKSQEQP